MLSLQWHCFFAISFFVPQSHWKSHLVLSVVERFKATNLPNLCPVMSKAFFAITYPAFWSIRTKGSLLAPRWPVADQWQAVEPLDPWLLKDDRNFWTPFMYRHGRKPPPIPLCSKAQQKLPSKGPLVASQLGATPSRAALSCLRIQCFNSNPLGRALS